MQRNRITGKPWLPRLTASPGRLGLRRRRSLLVVGLPALFLLLCTASGEQRAWANGGTVQVSSAQVGPYIATVLTTPSPLTAGPVDVTVAVNDPRITDPSKDNTVLDAQVQVTVQPSGGGSAPVTFPATHEQATNKLLYQANVNLPSGGTWDFSVQVAGRDGGGTVHFSADVTSSLFGSSSTQLICLALPVLGIIITGIVVLVRERRWKAKLAAGQAAFPDLAAPLPAPQPAAPAAMSEVEASSLNPDGEATSPREIPIFEESPRTNARTRERKS